MHWSQSFLSAFICGCLLALAFPPIDLSFFAWVGFVPLLWLIREHPPKRAFLLGWTAGMGFYLCTVYWVVHTIGLYSNIPSVVAVGPLLMMCAILAFYTGLFVAGLRFARQRGGAILLIGPPLWITCEWLRSFFFIGFPWLNLGYSQHQHLNLIQFVEFTSVYGLSALVMFVNLLIFTCWHSSNRRRIQLFATAVILVLGLSAWGSWRRSRIAALPPAHHLRIGLIQGNIPQDTKWHPNAQEETMVRYERLTREAVARGANLVIWPETAAPFFFQAETLPDAAYRERLLQLATAVKTPILFGSPAFKIRGTQVTLFNRAYLLSANAEIVDSYDKIQLVPFGEYIPFHRLLFFLDKLVVGIGDFAAGTEQTVFSLPQARFSVLICYEGIFPSSTREFVGRGAELLVNITNDAWFGRTSAPYQHLVMEAMRAVENRVPLVRAANTGFSAVVDLDGRIRSRTNLYETTLLVEDLSWPLVASFYARYGDVFVWLCVMSSSLMLGYCYLRRP
ncbi:MAG: apolipoprotein N-acyltransferase [Deltaproteobacteria bacterium]|nr:apolipoprotein N-acyltransferase [Deltaproteobacteria bacterium]